MRARTDLWEPGASNRLGPPGLIMLPCFRSYRFQAACENRVSLRRDPSSS